MPFCVFFVSGRMGLFMFPCSFSGSGQVDLGYRNFNFRIPVDQQVDYAVLALIRLVLDLLAVFQVKGFGMCLWRYEKDCGNYCQDDKRILYC
jgi:hypothetical protein